MNLKVGLKEGLLIEVKQQCGLRTMGRVVSLFLVTFVCLVKPWRASGYTLGSGMHVSHALSRQGKKSVRCRNAKQLCLEMLSKEEQHSEDHSLNANLPNLNVLNPEVLAILTVYFVQGSLGLARLATSYFMKDTLHLSPADMANIGGITTLPWVIKPLYGFLSDGFPLLGYRRRSYLVIAGLVGCLSWLSLGLNYAQGTNSLIALIVLGSASVAVSDVVVDSVVVERSRTGKVEGGELQSLCWGSAAVGGIISAYFSGSLLTTMSPQQVFTLTAVFPLLISASSILHPGGQGASH